MVFPFLTVVVTQLVGVEQAGMFSIAFVTGSLLMIVANYGVRTFQCVGLDEEHSFSDYQITGGSPASSWWWRAWAYCMVRGYADQMLVISIGVYLYKMVDGLADVYEGRLQQVDKLYLAGVSQAFRSVCVFVVFFAFPAGHAQPSRRVRGHGRNGGATFLFLTFPLALFETPKSQRGTARGILSLFKQCFPLFVALFMYSLIDNMPKFVMEGVLSYDNQLYFNALYFPAQMILLTIGLIYKPLLVRMAETWADPEKRRRFDLSIVVIVLVIVAITLVVALVMGWIGIPVMSFMYGLDFEPFRGLCFIMLAAGGVTGGHRLPLPGHHRAAPAKGGHAPVPHHVRLLAVRAHPAGELHRTAGGRDRLPHCHVHPAGSAGFGVHRHPTGIRAAGQAGRGTARAPAPKRSARGAGAPREGAREVGIGARTARRGAGAQDNQDDRDERQLPA